MGQTLQHLNSKHVLNQTSTQVINKAKNNINNTEFVV